MLFCSATTQEFFGQRNFFPLAWGWEHNDWLFIFEWTITSKVFFFCNGIQSPLPMPMPQTDSHCEWQHPTVRLTNCVHPWAERPTHTFTLHYLPRSLSANTSKKPSPERMYCSLIAPNSSWPAVSKTEKHKHTNTHIAFPWESGYVNCSMLQKIEFRYTDNMKNV